MVRRQLNIEDRGRAIAWLQGGNTQRNVAVRLGVSQCRWPTLATVPSNEFCSKSSTFGKTPKHYREDRYITNTALRQRTTTARRLRDNLRTATGTRVSDHTIRNRLRAIIYAAVARLFDHHSYHGTERPDVIGARFLCGGTVFSGVE